MEGVEMITNALLAAILIVLLYNNIKMWNGWHTLYHRIRIWKAKKQ